MPFKKNGKLFLTRLVASGNEVAILVDKNRTINTIWFDFCKAFDTVPQNMLVTKSLRYVLSGQTT